MLIISEFGKVFLKPVFFQIGLISRQKRGASFIEAEKVVYIIFSDLQNGFAGRPEQFAKLFYGKLTNERCPSLILFNLRKRKSK